MGVGRVPIADPARGGLITFNCIIQEGVIGEELQQRLAAELVHISGEVLNEPADDVSVGFEIVRRGYGFRGGEPSTTSLLRGRITPGLQQEAREVYMQRILDRWCELTGCSVDEVVINAADG